MAHSGVLYIFSDGGAPKRRGARNNSHLYDQANIEQTSSKCIQNTSARRGI